MSLAIYDKPDKIRQYSLAKNTIVLTWHAEKPFNANYSLKPFQYSAASKNCQIFYTGKAGKKG